MIQKMIAAYSALATLADDLDHQITLAILAFAPSASIEAIADRRDAADRDARAKLLEIADALFAADLATELAFMAQLPLPARAIVQARLDQIGPRPAPARAPIALSPSWDPWEAAGLS